MRAQSSVTSLSWIPSELVQGIPRLAFDAGLLSYDEPPPDRLDDVQALKNKSAFRFLNHLRAVAELDGGRIVDVHLAPGSGGVCGLTKFLGGAIRYPSLRMPDVVTRKVSDDGATALVRQTTGGRALLPGLRVAHGRLHLATPLVWTTLELAFHADGSVRHRVTGASRFPRHWVYDDDGTLIEKVALTDSHGWMHDDPADNPWRGVDDEALTTPVETALERRLSVVIMAADRDVQRLPAGTALFHQGDEATQVALLLDGIVEVTRDGTKLVELGPGAVLGERALLEGARTATVRAVTDVTVALVAGDTLPRDEAELLVAGHRREEVTQD